MNNIKAIILFLGMLSIFISEIEEVQASKLHTAGNIAYFNLDGTEPNEVVQELQKFLIDNEQSINQTKSSQPDAHVGYRVSSGKLYELHFSKAVQETELYAGINVREVRQFNVNWHIRVPRNGLETWGSVYSEMATPDGKPLFCVEPGRLVTGLSGYTPTVLPGNISLKMQQGASIGYSKTKDLAHYWNTQTFLWKELGAQFLVNSLYNQGIQNEITQGIANLSKRPSFQNQEVTLKIGQSITLTDKNGVFKEYEKLVSNTANLVIKRNGNQLILTAKADSKEHGVISFDRYKIEPQNIAYIKPGSQMLAWLRDPERNYNILKIKVLKNAPVIVEHRDKATKELLKTTKETKTIGSNYSYTPYNPLKIKENTYLPTTTKAQTGKVKDGTNKVVFYYDLERMITVSHVDKRTNQLIVPKSVEKKRRGQSYSYSPRTDLKKGTYSYRILTPHPVKGTVNGSHINITFYYDLPLVNVGFKQLEIYTAPAKKGLPVKLELNKELLYDEKQKAYDQQKLTVQLTDKETKKVVYTKEWTLRALPKEIQTTIASEFLEKNQRHNYEARFLELKEGEVISKAEKIDTDGYTSSEKRLNVTPHEAPLLVYKDVVMTGRTYGQTMIKKFEHFQMKTNKLAPQKTGYGFHYVVNPIYENECTVEGLPKPRFDLLVDQRLIESYLDYPIHDRTKPMAQIELETMADETTKHSNRRKQELPAVFLEKESGNVFSVKQKQEKDQRIKEPLIEGGRKVYVPMWMDLGEYPVELHSKEPIGVHEITIKVTDELPIKAYMFGHVKSPTIEQDEIILSPVHSDNPFPNGLPENFSEEDVKWFKQRSEKK